MDGLDLNVMFGAALGLAAPWQVVSVEFDPEAGRLDLGLDFPRGSRFACPEPGCAEAACSVHDTDDKAWRHLDFFEHQAYLNARVPRVRCSEHGVHLVMRAVGPPGQRLHAAVRGGDARLRQADADRATGEDGP